MFKVTIGREAQMACGCTVGKDMGVNTWAGFAGTDDNAIVDGDSAVLENELQSVLKTLRHGGINIVASITTWSVNRRASCSSTIGDAAGLLIWLRPCNLR